MVQKRPEKNPKNFPESADWARRAPLDQKFVDATVGIHGSHQAASHSCLVG